jgi:hypothetical protein
MHTSVQNAQQQVFEVILYSEGRSWLFSTYAQASKEQEALERAETEFTVHSAHHRLSHRRMEATSAHVLNETDNRTFAKRNGRWHLVH